MIYEKVEFFDFENKFCLGFRVDEERIAFINGDNNNSAEINLPKGSWNLLISTDEMRNDKMKRYEGVIMLKPTSGILLEQK